MNSNGVILVITDDPRQKKLFQAAFRSSARAFRGVRALFCDSDGWQKVLEAELSSGAKLLGGVLDFPARSAPRIRELVRNYRELVSMDAKSGWLIVHQPSLDVRPEAERMFGRGAECRWDSLRKPVQGVDLRHKLLRIAKCGVRPEDGESPGAELREALLAERSERLALLGQLSRGIGHEFGNILLKISGRAELALSEESLERVREHLAIVSSAAERAGLIVRNLQSLSKTAIQPEPVAPAAILEEALLQTLHNERARSIKVIKKYSATSKALADVRSVSQVFMNLVLNAIEAMPKGGQLTLRVARDPERSMLAVSVADSGAGIPAHVLPRIFDFAFTTKGDMGTGLGLSISKQVVEAHGGEIRIETREGKGTCVTVFLPEAPAGSAGDA